MFILINSSVYENVPGKVVRPSLCVIFLILVDIPFQSIGKDFLLLLLLSLSAHYLWMHKPESISLHKLQATGNFLSSG